MMVAAEKSVAPADGAAGIIGVFWAMVGLFVVLMLALLTGVSAGSAKLNFVLIMLGAVFLALGMLLSGLVWQSTGLSRPLRGFLLLTGLSAAAFLVVLVLGGINILLTMYTSIRISPGQDGGWIGALAFLYILFACPALFAIGTLGTLYLLATARRQTAELS
jgi:hypothetical protein